MTAKDFFFKIYTIKNRSEFRNVLVTVMVDVVADGLALNCLHSGAGWTWST